MTLPLIGFGQAVPHEAAQPLDAHGEAGDVLDVVKLGDFGIARLLAHTRAKARTVAGTPFYMAPELLQEKPYSVRSQSRSILRSLTN